MQTKLFLLGCIIWCSSVLGSDNYVSGAWIGGFDRGEEFVFIQLKFKKEGNSVSGTYDAPLLFLRGKKLENLSLKGSKISFSRGEEVFTGGVTNEVMTGLVKDGSVERTFTFTRLAPINLDQYAGAYALGRERFVFLRGAIEIGLGALQIIDFKSGKVAVLYPQSTIDFFSGPALLVPHPPTVRTTFKLDANGRATNLQSGGAEKWSAKRIDFRQEEVVFTNGTVNLSGTLVVPQTPGPHPVIVFAAGGTAAGTREMFRFYAEFLALHGIAGFIYDKRGLGKSSGNWMKASFGDLAEDVLAAVQVLKVKPGINPKRIGLFGASQSGWIVALAASRSKDVAFIISQSGPGVTPKEQELYRSESWLRADGFSEADISEARSFINQRYNCAETGKGWDALAETERQVKHKAWFSYSGGSVGKSNPFWDFWNIIRDYDPRPSLENVTCPVLAILGGKDTYLPVEKSAAIWKSSLERAGNKDFTIRIFANGDHSLIESKTGGVKESARAERFVPGFFDALLQWALTHSK